MTLKTALLATAATILFSAPALATESKPDEDCPPGEAGAVEIDAHQKNKDEVVARQEIEAGHVGDVFGGSVAASNLLTGAGGSIEADVTQFQGDVTVAETVARVGGAEGDVVLNAIGAGNGTTLFAEDGPLNVEVRQSGHGQTRALVSGLIDSAANAVGVASAGVNAVQLAAPEGGVSAHIDQTTTRGARAQTDIAVFGTLEGDGVAAATSATNSAHIAAGGDAYVHANQVSGGEEVTTISELYARRMENGFSQASAAGNTFALGVEGGDANLLVHQNNRSLVRAHASAAVGDEASGDLGALSYGVGNAASAWAVGERLNTTFLQTNTGGVSSTAETYGAIGGVNSAQATAIGNSASAALCASCGENEAIGLLRQHNSGPVYAGSSVQAPYANRVVGTATAIGNTATFSTTTGSTTTGHN